MNHDIAGASRVSLAALLAKQCRLKGERTAVVAGNRTITYAQLDDRARRLQSLLSELGCSAGDRICILSENAPIFLELAIAAIRLRLIVSTLNWRLSAKEMKHCVELVGPTVTIVSPRFSLLIAEANSGETLETGDRLDELIGQYEPMTGDGCDSDPEAGLFIIYTSGTTGLPKGALISRRAILARIMVYVSDYGVNGDDTFIAWSPLCHMASIELGLGTLLLGGKVVVMDGPDLPTICDYLESDNLSNLIFFPGMVEQVLAYLRERRPRVKRLKKFGAMADLFAPQQIADLTTALGVPFTNTFGSTETGMAPASAGRLACGEIPSDLSKAESLLCEIALFDELGKPVFDGQPGELVMRGPTLFSGYWNAAEATEDAFRGGWYHTGDVFMRRPDGRLNYVDRSKYLIKSGGENIYPAEIERVALQHPAIAEAVVVRQADPKWGEVPVLVVAADAPAPSADDIIALCRSELAAYKRPKRVLFVAKGSLPRNHTGKIIRAEVEIWVREQSSAA